jgi:hypothetical protein
LFVLRERPVGATRATRRMIASAASHLVPVTFGISHDGARVAISYRQQASDLMVAEGVAGLAR